MPVMITGEDLVRLASETSERNTEDFWISEQVDVEGIMELADMFATAAQRLILGSLLKQESPEGYLESALGGMFEIGWEAHKQFRSNG